MKIIFTLALAVLGLVACGGSAGHAVAGPTVTVTRTVTVTATPTASAQPTPSGNIPLAPNHLPPGPFKITAEHCGPYTAAEQAKYATSAKGGLVYGYTNVSNSVVGFADLSVTFLSGGTATGENTATTVPIDISPGQTATAAVDAVVGSGQDALFTSCQLNYYAVVLPGQDAMAAPFYAP